MGSRNVFIFSKFPLVKSWLTDKVVSLGWESCDENAIKTSDAVVLLDIWKAEHEQVLNKMMSTGQPVVIFSRHPPQRMLKFFYEYEINGFLHLEATNDSIQEILEAADRNEEYFDEAVLPYILSDHYRGIHEQLSSLSERELEIIDGIMDELNNQEIAEKHGLSVRTVNAHKRNILQKIKVKSLVGLVKKMMTYSIRYV